MTTKPALLTLSVSALAFFILCCSGCGDSVSAQTTPSSQVGGTSPVAPSSLVGKTTSHRTGQHDYQFCWKFDASNFEISGNSITDDLLKDLGCGEQIGKITGKWKVEKESILLATDVNGETIKWKMKIFTTGPIRIQSNAAQYVF